MHACSGPPGASAAWKASSARRAPKRSVGSDSDTDRRTLCVWWSCPVTQTQEEEADARRASTTKMKAYTETKAHEAATACSSNGACSNDRERRDEWEPSPNVRLPSGRWVYHPDFDIDLSGPEKRSSIVGVWEHAHVLPNGLLKDTSPEAPSGVDGRHRSANDPSVAGTERRSPPRIRRLPCVRPA